MLRRETNEAWTDKYAPKCEEETGRGRKMVAEKRKRHWMVEREEVKRMDTEKDRLYHCPTWREDRNQIPEGLRKWEQRATTSKDWTWQRGITSGPLNESNWRQGHLSVHRWEKHKSWRTSAEGFRDDGSLLRVPGGVRADGPWCSLITTRRWCQCMGCTERWMPSLRYSAPSRQRS